MPGSQIAVSPKLMKGMSPARARVLGISEDERVATVIEYASPPMVEPQPQPCMKEVDCSLVHRAHTLDKDKVVDDGEETKAMSTASTNMDLGRRCQTRDNERQRRTTKPNMNADITDIFLDISEIYKTHPSKAMPDCESHKQSNNMYRSKQYKAVAHGLASLNVKVNSGEDAVAQLKKAGKTKPGRSMIKDINEILNTGVCHRLEIFRAQLALAKIFGVGPKKAKSLINKGITNVEQLKQREDLLTKEMKICLKYIEDLQYRIPRSEVERIGSFVQSEVQSLHTGVSYDIVGSYRRPRESCAVVLSTLIRRLKCIGFISDTLKSPSLRKAERSQTWLGICRLPYPGSFNRRVDINVYPLSELPFAKLYFTGRMKARKKGLVLTDHGLHKRVFIANGKGESKQSTRGTSEECETEEDVFNALGSPYIPPHERDV